MKQQSSRATHVVPGPRGYTMLEVAVAMTVFGIALAGLFPLMAILSRDLQPVRQIAADGTVTYDCKTPARDGNTDGLGVSPPPAYLQHVWYLTPYSNPSNPGDPNVPWVRKLGVSAQMTSGTLSYYSPPSVTPSVVEQDDYEGTPSGDGDGTFSAAGWDYINNGSASQASGADYHCILASPIGTTPLPSPAVWTLNVPASGQYSIQATWLASDDQVPDACYTVPNGSGGTVNVFMNQQLAPDNQQPPVSCVTSPDPQPNQNNTRPWAQLAVVNLTQGAVTVQLAAISAASAKYVVADAVRIVQRNDVKVESIERSLTGVNQNSSGADVTAHVSVTVNIPE